MIEQTMHQGGVRPERASDGLAHSNDTSGDPAAGQRDFLLALYGHSGQLRADGRGLWQL